MPQHSTTLSRAELLVRDPNATADFYRNIVGLEPDGSSLHDPKSGDSILDLVFDPNAKRPAQPRAGLFHLAFLYPDPASLSAAVRRVLDGGARAHGFQDHGVSEAFYLSDPEGNGLELYVDRPESEWPRKGTRIAMYSEAIDLSSWLDGHPAGDIRSVSLGHVHLRASSLTESERFYTNDLDMSVTQDDYPGARFMAWDGYHHHVAVNTWSGEGLPPRQPDETGLLSFTISGRPDLPRESRDPDGIVVHSA